MMKIAIKAHQNSTQNQSEKRRKTSQKGKAHYKAEAKRELNGSHRQFLAINYKELPSAPLTR